jgi:hypothetical protein
MVASALVLYSFSSFILCGSSFIPHPFDKLRTGSSSLILSQYVPPRPAFAGIHIAMPEDSAFLIMRRIAARYDTLHVDSITLLESDSVQIFGQPAYLQLQIVHHVVRTIVINWFPLGGDGYTGLRDVLISYLERYFGHGIVFTDESLTYHRWETDDGTSEVSHSDKYLRVFVRIGKPR